MAWTVSKIFRPYMADVLGNVAQFDLDADTIKAALFNNTITPAQDVTSANARYGGGVWASGEVSQAGQWDAGGVALASKVVDSTVAGTVFFDAANTASGSAATLADVYGVLVYDDTLTTPVADQGVCYNYLGGVQSVTNGTFTVVWDANGIFRLTL